MSVNPDGMFFGILTNQEYDIEHEKVEIVRKHISKFDAFLPSQKMIDRLQSLYHPEVIKAYPEDFNRNWRKAWGIN